jgi:NAD(P)-dependent dehydrogenase (short-subunit alcohol dehydrogenase family)
MTSRAFTAQGVFITGGCGDIGSEVARRFLAEGARVVLADLRPRAEGEAFARRLGGDCAYVRCNATDASSVDQGLRAALRFLGRLDVAICNAGMVANQPVLDADEKDWRRTLEVNLTGSFLVAQRAARIMVKNRPRGGHRGSILFTGSWVQEMPWPQGAAYCSSKGGQVMLMKTLAQELAARGVTANIVAPGFVYAGLTKGIYDRSAVFRKQVNRGIPLGRLSTAAEVAGAFLFLAGADGRYITGSTLLVDGGASLVRRDG